MNDELIWIVLKLPNRALSPNARVRPYMKRAAARKQRADTCAAIQAQNANGLPWDKCEVSVKLYHQTNRRRDLDNAVSMLKSMFDGIVDAGVVVDDTPEYMTRKWPEFATDKSQPRMEVVIRRAE